MAAACSDTREEKVACILCLGMAGSGKTTFVQVTLPLDRLKFYSISISCKI